MIGINEKTLSIERIRLVDTKIYCELRNLKSNCLILGVSI